MKVIGYTALHYGRDYLGYAIRSVIDAVEEYHVLYTSQGSHGHRSQAHCPETRLELFEIAEAAAGAKVRWHEGSWLWEGQQRDAIFEYAPDADVVLVLDADEIWSEELIETIARLPAENAPVRTLRLSMIHFWRSFHRAIMHDPAWPERVIFPKASPIDSGTFSLSFPGVISHMGYAQRP